MRIVKLPTAVVRIDESAFRGSHWLNSKTALGCTDFGFEAFADCCSLQVVHANGEVNTFSGATKLDHFLFDSCILMLHAVVEPQSLTPAQRRELPAGCFFLHGYGRYVCREAQVTMTNSERGYVDEPEKQDQQRQTKPQKHKTNHNKHQTEPRGSGSNPY